MLFNSIFENYTICSYCLSFGRTLQKVTESKSFFTMYLKIQPFSDLMCWECATKLKNFNRFLANVHSTHNILVDFAEKYPDIKIHNLEIHKTSQLGLSNKIKIDETKDESNDITVNTLDELNQTDSDNETLSQLRTIKVKKKHKNKLKNYVLIFKIDDDMRETMFSNDLASFRNAKWKYPCEKCFFGTHCEVKFMKHEEKHKQKNGPEVCDICTIRFKDFSKLQDHKRKHYKAYKCKKCDFATSIRALMVEHLELEKRSSELRCDLCGITFKNHLNQKYHMKSKHAMVKPRCDCCDKEFATKSNLKDHLNGYERNKMRRKVQCKICLKWFTRKNNYNDHLKSHDIVKELYECNICKRKFVWKSNWDRHMKKHISKESNQYKCIPCNRIYSSLETFKNHNSYTLVHGPSPIFQIERKKKHSCHFCDKVFNQRINLSDHIDWVHIKVMKYRCDTCKGHFKSKLTLRQHMKVHSKSEKNLCHLCGKGYKNDMSLRVHILNKHGTQTVSRADSRQGDERFSCLACDVTFKTKSNLVRHRRAKHQISIDANE